MMRPLGQGTLRIDLTDDITPALAAAIDTAMDEHSHRSIEIICHSDGGCWHSSRRIFQRLVSHDKRVTARISKAHSGAALIMMAADHREMAPCGTLFLHWPASNDATPAYLADVAETKARLIATRARVPVTRLLRWMQGNTLFSAERALHCGLVDAVPGLRPPSTPTVYL
jgi:ATP-dependent protease ClpP protease subunit